MNKSPAEIRAKRMIGFLWLALVCFFNTVPLFIISILANLNSVSYAELISSYDLFNDPSRSRVSCRSFARGLVHHQRHSLLFPVFYLLQSLVSLDSFCPS